YVHSSLTAASIPEISTLSLHDALPISWKCSDRQPELGSRPESSTCSRDAFIVQRGSANLRIADLVTALTILDIPARLNDILGYRSEEHTSELQSRENLV